MKNYGKQLEITDPEVDKLLENRKKKKKIMSIIMGILIIGILGTGVTIAWLTTITDTKTNVFNVLTASGVDPDMTAELIEEQWALHQKEALKMVPGATVPKDPVIKNTSKEPIDQWVGIRLTFTKGNGTVLTATEMQLLNRVISYTVDSSWVRKNTSANPEVKEMFYYNALLAQNTATKNLFPSVQIKPTAINSELATIKDQWGGFQIKVEGAAVQGDVSSSLDTAVKNALDSLLPL